jgi:hypothetical protein
VLPKKSPYNKSCCNRYPVPSLPHFVFLAMALLVGPYLSYNTFKSGEYFNHFLLQYITVSVTQVLEVSPLRSGGKCHSRPSLSALLSL